MGTSRMTKILVTGALIAPRCRRNALRIITMLLMVLVTIWVVALIARLIAGNLRIWSMLGRGPLPRPKAMLRLLHRTLGLRLPISARCTAGARVTLSIIPIRTPRLHRLTPARLDIDEVVDVLSELPLHLTCVFGFGFGETELRQRNLLSEHSLNIAKQGTLGFIAETYGDS